MNKTQYIVVIEWDGKQPPTSYYNALRALKLRVKGGDKDNAPMLRRTGLVRGGDTNYVVAQEGCVICPSESLARQVRREANNYGARSVMIGEVEFDTSPYVMNADDRMVIDRFNSIFRRRGRPPATDEKQWHWWCPECNATGHETQRDPVIQCGTCGGLRVASKAGKLVVWKSASGISSFQAWASTRWADGSFMRPLPDDAPPDVAREIAPVANIPADDAELYQAMESVFCTSRLSCEVLDSVYAARKYSNAQDRSRERAKAAMFLYQRGVEISEAPLVETSTPDILDAACIYGAVKTAEAFISERNNTARKP